MRISDILRDKRPCFSFEFFPPRSDEGVAALLDTVATLRALDPGFVSVTYGAGGSTRERTLEVVTSIKSRLGLEAMAHLTCVGASVDELRDVMARVAEAGIDNVLALRGDPPRGFEEFRMPPGGLRHAADLVRLARAEFSFCIGGACHPETHLEAPDAATDLRYLATKVEAGAEFLITQLFFDNEIYFEFVERARRAGIGVPIIPGIMPITSAEQIARFTRMCGASIPASLLAELEARKDQPEAVQDLGVAFATLQCADLLARGAPAIHFYTLNKSPAARAVVSALLAARPWETSGATRYESERPTMPKKIPS
ncbi:MAG TPA: methylenetetrahydrofolate reductase [NAD(P)H] [Candidatus Tumulicola sp.]|nr:methylenetetrahydrofolate reductase [NAD(P)H] [Candidatus Tumulicola sp.]